MNSCITAYWPGTDTPVSQDNEFSWRSTAPIAEPIKPDKPIYSRSGRIRSQAEIDYNVKRAAARKAARHALKAALL